MPRLAARVVLFDWDGTLLDSCRADSGAYREMFRTLGIQWTPADFERHYSPNWYRVYKAARLPRAQWARADRLWKRAYRDQNPPLLRGARSIVQTLHRNFRLGIVSSGSGWRVRKQIRGFDLRRYFSACVCSEDTPRRKPHPEPLRLALKRLRARPEDAVYVGDTPEDMQMARRAGVRAIGVLGPFPTAAKLRAERPEVILESVRELRRVLVAAG